MAISSGIADFDVLVVGGGAAGLYSALCLPTHLRVGLLTKDTLAVSASDWAQGGIAAAIAPDDSPILHIEDTLRAGAGLCEPEAVTLLVEEARQCIDSLVDLGVAFDRSGQQLAMTLEAAHSRKRVLHAADTTGHAIVLTLAQRVLSQKNIKVFDRSFALDLWVEAGDCKGVCLSQADAEGAPDIRWLPARAVVLATGGGGQVFSQTTNPEASTGDGVAMAWRAGAKIRDLEFFQFHPTALTQAGAPRFLISEAVRGEGAHLLDSAGYRFAFDYHPDGELAPRDVVSRAIFSHLQKNKDADVVYLDLSPIDPERIQYRFPNIIRVCKQWGVDLFSQPIPVSPAAHYWMGGIVAGRGSETTIRNLYAVGENASTGVHGANRLASNSLLECLVYGAQLKDIQLEEIKLEEIELEEIELTGEVADPMAARASAVEIGDDWHPQIAQLTQWRDAIPQLIWAQVGISREQGLMEAAIAQISQWQAQFNQLSITQALDLKPGKTAVLESVSGEQVRLWGEVRNLLAIAALILKSANFRTESRGGHYRSDYPTSQSDWLVHTLIQNDRCWKSELAVASATKQPI
ncbi:L-aspartate oxidase [cf. Phormidesmis sp. LEGE 11477]|uniref:L-aspartate oxidase n=1 Tax=cf. Phormidesmis sp. LEGE 11477 TaxID=1828680 RepID=UPI001D151946|nr:L-aspartate oxidase [cf. Phormidesmis sp. LEGE 11477]